MLPLSDGLHPRRFPIVNVALIAANFAVWLFYELPHLSSAVYHASFYPCTVDGSCRGPEPWGISWLTSMFMHGSWSHILGNMLFLAIFGKNVEDAFGRVRYLGFYLAGGFVATMTQTAVTLLFGTAAAARVPNLGASGAIAAVLGAFFILYPTARIRTLVLVFFVQIPAWVFLGGWFVYQLVEAHAGLTSSSANGGGVAFFAHIGGFAFGALVTLAPAQRRARRPAEHRATRRAGAGLRWRRSPRDDVRPRRHRPRGEGDRRRTRGRRARLRDLAGAERDHPAAPRRHAGGRDPAGRRVARTAPRPPVGRDPPPLPRRRRRSRAARLARGAAGDPPDRARARHVPRSCDRRPGRTASRGSSSTSGSSRPGPSSSTRSRPTGTRRARRWSRSSSRSPPRGTGSRSATRSSRLLTALTPEAKRDKARETYLALDDRLGAYTRLRFLMIFAVGAVLSAGFYVVGLNYWLLVGAFAGLVEIVPVVGPIVASILVLAVGLPQSLHVALLALLWLVVVREFQSYVVNPHIGQTVGLSPLVTLVSVAVVGVLFGGLAVILAVPFTSAVATLIDVLVLDHEPPAAQPRRSLRLHRSE